MKEWPFLIGAIVLETFATTMLKYSEQFTKIIVMGTGTWVWVSVFMAIFLLYS